MDEKNNSKNNTKIENENNTAINKEVKPINDIKNNNTEEKKEENEQKEVQNTKQKTRVKKVIGANTDVKEENIITANSQLLFNKYSYDVEVRDPSLKNYICLKPLIYPTTFRRTSKKKFSKANINIVERLANDMQRGGTGGKIGGKVIRTKGRLQGKKVTIMRIIEDAFDIINKQTNQNPLQLLIYAIENSAPIEDTTRVRYGGIISNISVDVSASRRLDIALKNLALATIIGSFGNKKDIVSTLANEIILASKNDINSYAIKRKNEIERMARSAK
jgi:small subunit ribosomal protein S7